MVKLELDFTPSMKQLEDLTKKPWLTSWMTGGYSSLVRGSGIEFDGFGVYTPEQDSRKIDWKASAKSEKLLLRNYVEERNITCQVILDVSTSMFFSSTKKLKCEYAAELVNALLFAVVSSGDQAGLFMASDTIAERILPKGGKKHYFQLLDTLTNEKNYGGKSSLSHTLETLFKSKDKGIVFIVSDFLHVTEDELEMITLLRKNFEVFVFMVRDRFERYLPNDVNAVSIEDMNGSQTIIVNIRELREEYAQEMKENEDKLTGFFLKHDVQFEKFYTHTPLTHNLMNFFEGKKHN